jgi:hypothetical protein
MRAAGPAEDDTGTAVAPARTKHPPGDATAILNSSPPNKSGG